MGGERKFHLFDYCTNAHNIQMLLKPESRSQELIPPLQTHNCYPRPCTGRKWQLETRAEN